MISLAAWWLMSNLGLVVFYAVVALIVAYGIAAVVPVWRSATVYGGGKGLKYAARGIASVASAIQVVAVGTVVFTLFSIKLGFDPTHDPERIAPIHAWALCTTPSRPSSMIAGSSPVSRSYARG